MELARSARDSGTSGLCRRGPHVDPVRVRHLEVARHLFGIGSQRCDIVLDLRVSCFCAFVCAPYAFAALAHAAHARLCRSNILWMIGEVTDPELEAPMNIRYACTVLFAIAFFTVFTYYTFLIVRFIVRRVQNN